ncbi:phosphocarrier protein [Desulfohalotomaculum tongense]|uniref:HPr family phosphocarrier protein n=1 Tax=Desulforadius tongensis TaxID=1216062 RepID=UPI0019589C9E|nr:HPr family phosphocarrier protein [Desulforadius tongensis]MBM7854809.1 phosphocarrier protein [Desulforadius tongensis]
MIVREVEVTNKAGLHMRPAAQIVQTAGKYDSQITLEKDCRKANAKSIMDVVAMGIKKGTVITIRAEGDDEKEAVDALVNLIMGNFDEE